MTRLQELESRVAALESQNEALMDVVNHLVELVYDKRFIGKLDKLVNHGKKNG